MRRRRRIDNPTLAESFAGLRSDYRAAKDTRFQSRLSGVASMGSGADYHYRNERQFLHMMERARHYRRNDAIVGQGIRRLVANVIQDGFNLDVTTGDDGLNAELKSRWMDWAGDADQCHSEGELTFNQIERMTLESVLVDGDLLHLPLRAGSLQPVEAHRLRTPRNTTRNVVHGVLLDNNAKRREYWVSRQDLNPNQSLAKVADVRRIAARDSDGRRQVLHIYDPYRFSQRRGVTCIAPISETIGIHDDIQFATLVKAQMAALVTILRERGPDWEPGSDIQTGPRETETTNGYTRTLEGVGAGMEIAGDVGETFKAFAPNIPNAEYFQHSHLILTFIAINLDLPVAVLLLDPSETNFSGWRGAIDQARIRFRQIQRWLIDAFYSPVYRWKVRQWMARDPALASAMGQSGVNPLSHRWNPPTWRYIEPLKDASADLLQQRNALTSPRRLQAARGADWDDVYREIIEDNSKAIRAAVLEANDINAELDAGVHWRELISLPTPDGVSVAVGGSEPREANDNAA